MADTVLMQGETLSCLKNTRGIIELCLDNKQASVNKFNTQTLNELHAACQLIQQQKDVKGLVFTTAKDSFVVGADITEFLPYFKDSSEKMEGWLEKTQKLYNAFEDLPFPTVAALHGMCLGGGFELALSCSYRIASSKASVGLPETKLGIIPGWGGCVRLPRLIGADNALEWIAGAATYPAQTALRYGAIDAVVELDRLKEAAFQMIEEAQAHRGHWPHYDWQKRAEEKKSPLTLRSDIEKTMVFQTTRAFVASKAYPHYPAPLEAVTVVEKTAHMRRDEALAVERKAFIKLTQSPVAESLITIFLADQYNKKQAKKYSSKGKVVKSASVLGAGIMGGGIAYQSASKGIPILMKDIQPEALVLGMTEANTLLLKQLENKKIDALTMGKVLSSISPTLSYGDFKKVDVVVEAVVENIEVKKSVLADVEKEINEDAVLASNTSTISINELAKGLKRPHKFCGMHFFNPVHRMPLVEVIRGEKSDEATIGTVVSYALSMGKVPVVVGDCPGFLVNRVLFPYFWAFGQLVAEGVEISRLDKVMEKFGWPMGPAYLLDVIGLDTAWHAEKIIAKGYPDRMTFESPSLLEVLVKAKRLGQKNKVGFYRYSVDKKGKLKKELDPTLQQVIQGVFKTKNDKLSDDDLIMRMMIPLIHESTRCLEEGIVGSPMELDLALINGIGFPPFLGGAIKYLDFYGMQAFADKAQSFRSYGACYEPSELLKKMTREKKSFYQGENL